MIAKTKKALLYLLILGLSQCTDLATPSPGGKFSSGPCPVGDAWTTVDDFFPGVSNVVADFASDSTGGLYAVGTVVDGVGNHHWIVRRSKDNAKTWTTSDDFQYPGGRDSQAMAVAVDAANNVFVVGSALDAQGTRHWLIREGANEALGAWMIAKDYVYPGALDSRALAVGVDLLGNIYATGTALSHIVTLQSTNLGGSWQLIDDYNPGTTVQVSSLGINLSQTVFIVGAQGTNPVRWLTRAGVFSINAWVFSNSDFYVYAGNSQNQATGLGVDGSNNAFVIGTTGVPGNSQWLMKKTSNGGANWNVLATFPAATGGFSYAGGAWQDGLGGVYAALQMKDASSSFHNQIIASVDSGAHWNVLDDFVYSAPASSLPRVKSDNSGKTYALFTTTNSDGSSHWQIRTCY